MIEIKLPEETIKIMRVSVILNDSFSSAIQFIANQIKEMQRDEDEREQQLKKFAALLNPPNLEELRETFEKFIEEINKTVIAIGVKDELRQSWRHNAYRNKLHSRLVSKKMQYHNCRNNC